MGVAGAMGMRRSRVALGALRVVLASVLLAGPAMAQSPEAGSLADRFARSANADRAPARSQPPAADTTKSVSERERAAVVRRQMDIAAEEDDLSRREAEMLSRARAELSPEQPMPGAEAAAPALPPGVDPARVLEDQRLKELVHGLRPQPDLEARHEEQLARLSERIKKAQARRAAQILARNVPRPGSEDYAAPPALQPPFPDVTDAPAPRAPVEPAVQAAASVSGRATVLLVMSPGHNGIRRFSKTADPVLCVGPQCYVSRGADREAEARRVSMVLGAGNTLGKRAGACNHSLGCVFRDVALVPGAEVQPVDMRILKHDRREVRAIQPDGTCQLERGRLVCAGGVRSATYTMWVVPEDLARKLSPSVLEAAVAAGLPG